MARTPQAALLAAVGDVVMCREPAFRENLKLPDELGLVLETRPDRAKVFLPGSGGEPWVPVETLARVRQPAGVPSVRLWMQRAHFLARSLDAVRMEVAHVGEDGCALRVFHGELPLDLLDELRTALGDELRDGTLLPAGLHKIESAIAFVPRERTDAPRPRPRAGGEEA
jgi:hypothetical protein